MNPLLFVPFLFLSPLIGRENPFFPTSDTPTITSNLSDSKPVLTSARYALPDTARLLKEVTITFQNADGTIDTRKIDIDKSIDWHKPLIVTQGGSVASTSADNPKTSSSADFGFIRFDTRGKWLTVITAVPVLRHFVLSEPNRIVIDFKNNKIFSKRDMKLNAPPFLSVSVANHGTFGRASITLDGRYRYTLKQTGETIVITCR
jgi:hypothetical protein